MTTAALIYRSDHASGKKPMPTPSGPEVVNVLTSLTLTAAQTDALAANDIIVMGYLPENCAFVDAICAFTNTTLDSGNAMDLDFGIVADDEADFVASTGELQNSILVANTTNLARVTMTEEMLLTNSASNTRKKLGFKVATAAHTAGAGTIYLSLSYRATSFGA